MIKLIVENDDSCIGGLKFIAQPGCDETEAFFALINWNSYHLLRINNFENIFIFKHIKKLGLSCEISVKGGGDYVKLCEALRSVDVSFNIPDVKVKIQI